MWSFHVKETDMQEDEGLWLKFIYYFYGFGWLSIVKAKNVIIFLNSLMQKYAFLWSANC